jgi:putative flippase GtrA
MKNIIRDRSIRKFILVGLVYNLIGYLLYLGITFLGAKPQYAVIFLFVINLTMGYFGHRKVSFESNNDVVKSSMSYLLTYIVALGINLGLLTLFVDQLRFPHQLVQATCIVVIACFSFLSLKYLVFKN